MKSICTFKKRNPNETCYSSVNILRIFRIPGFRHITSVIVCCRLNIRRKRQVHIFLFIVHSVFDFGFLFWYLFLIFKLIFLLPFSIYFIFYLSVFFSFFFYLFLLDVFGLQRFFVCILLSVVFPLVLSPLFSAIFIRVFFSGFSFSFFKIFFFAFFF